MKRKNHTPEKEHQEIEDLEQQERSSLSSDHEEVIESHIDLYDPEDYQIPERHIQVRNY